MLNIKIIIESYKEEFNLRNDDIEYIVGLSFKAELYGYDSILKKNYYNNRKNKRFYILNCHLLIFLYNNVNLYFHPSFFL